MLCLTRKAGERVIIGESIRITVIETRSGRLRLGIEAEGLEVFREEILPTYHPFYEEKAHGSDERN